MCIQLCWCLSCGRLDISLLNSACFSHDLYFSLPCLSPAHTQSQPANKLLQKLKKEARTRCLEKKAEELLTEDEIEYMWQLIQENLASPPYKRRVSVYVVCVGVCMLYFD